MALEENKYTHLVELGGSDYEIIDGEPDIRDWDVKNNFGLKIGEVDELLFDPQTSKVRYIVIDINNSKLDIEQKKIIVPIGAASLYDDGRIQGRDNDNILNRRSGSLNNDEMVVEGDSQLPLQEYEKTYNPNDDGKVVVIPINKEHILLLPAYHRQNVSPETELSVRQVFDGLDGTISNVGAIEYKPDEFYNHEHFNEEKFYNTLSSRIRKKL